MKNETSNNENTKFETLALLMGVDADSMKAFADGVLRELHKAGLADVVRTEGAESLKAKHIINCAIVAHNTKYQMWCAEMMKRESETRVKFEAWFAENN